MGGQFCRAAIGQTLQFSTENFRQANFLFPKENFRHYFFRQKIFDTFCTGPWKIFDKFWQILQLIYHGKFSTDYFRHHDMSNFSTLKRKIFDILKENFRQSE